MHVCDELVIVLVYMASVIMMRNVSREVSFGTYSKAGTSECVDVFMGFGGWCLTLGWP
jgi:hypothetical protein